MVIGALTTVAQFPGNVYEKLRGIKNVPLGTTQRFRFHNGILIPTKEEQEHGLLTKKNWVIRNTADLTGFNHFISCIFHPQNFDPQKPVILLIPGMLCNGNLFRITYRPGNFKDLSSDLSFANSLAFAGYKVAIVHPRYSKWLNKRYVRNKLGVPNNFSKTVNIMDLVQDLGFYIDAAIGLSGAKKAVVAGFSMGGIELLLYLAFCKNIDPRLAASIFLEVPVDFSENDKLVMKVLRYYGRIAKFLPTDNYHALNIINKNIAVGKTLARHLFRNHTSAELANFARKTMFLRELFNLEKTDPETIIPIALYVLESMSNPIINDLLHMVDEGEVINPLTGEKALDHLPENAPPSLIVTSSGDHLARPKSGDRLSQALREKNPSGVIQWENLEDCGHVDAITGDDSRRILEIMRDFLEST